MNLYLTPKSTRRHSSGLDQQRGVVLLFSLIALAIMLIAAVALVRSFNSSMFTAGNIAFKRDLQNQSERAVDKALGEFRSGGALDTVDKRAANLPGSNYSAKMLAYSATAANAATNAAGIPYALRSDSSFAAAGFSGADIEPTGQGVKIRYVIDRLCADVGDEKTLGKQSPPACSLGDDPTPSGNSADNQQSAERAATCASCPPPARLQSVLYRLSVKVSGPRDTQSFFQSTFTVPTPN